MANVMSKAKRRQPEEFEPVSQTCIAHDCPMKWTHTDSLNGSSSGFCRYHHNKQPARWAHITRMIDENIQLFQWATKLLKVPVLEFHSSPGKYEHKEIPLADGEDLFSYRRKLLNEFKKRVDF